MNCIYRSIWNDKLGTYVAAAENTASRGKSASAGGGRLGAGAGLALQALTAAMLLGFGQGAHALPVGGVVAAGNAAISGGAGAMTVQQTSARAVINWQGFSIGNGESVRFVQPDSSAVALNRVLGSDPSNILGSLSANGRVFLVNPNGILFGPSAQVNVGGLVASTLNLTDGDFMAGRYRFAGSGGSVVNQGSISADRGYVALLGANVDNQGVISANLGTVALAAGSAVTLDMAGDGLLNVAVDQAAVHALVENGGLIRADGGQVVLSARSAGDLLQTVVNTSGVIQARSIESRNGSIRLLGDMQTGAVKVGGALDVSGLAPGQTGGSVRILAQAVDLAGASINASGDAGGGTVLAGGNL
ncbi:MAG: filamentous hemagglutinin N-terminal domain-containing protein, partial [Burkholderiaceae bacterium]|nr:filamentous hemagglutinin N-terminal domain-containing protein [Burkholderiaceae bacterium]